MLELLDTLQSAGWNVEAGRCPLPEEIRVRYPTLPPDLVAFLESIRVCANAADTAWFVTPATDDASAFRWNEWELISLEAADGDAQVEEEIRKFWDRHFPFLLSVKDGYAYVAIITAGDGTGTIVTGSEPLFESVSLLAGNLDEFAKIVSDALRREDRAPLSLLI